MESNAHARSNAATGSPSGSSAASASTPSRNASGSVSSSRRDQTSATRCSQSADGVAMRGTVPAAGDQAPEPGLRPAVEWVAGGRRGGSRRPPLAATTRQGDKGHVGTRGALRRRSGGRRSAHRSRPGRAGRPAARDGGRAPPAAGRPRVGRHARRRAVRDRGGAAPRRRADEPGHRATAARARAWSSTRCRCTTSSGRDRGGYSPPVATVAGTASRNFTVSANWRKRATLPSRSTSLTFACSSVRSRSPIAAACRVPR